MQCPTQTLCVRPRLFQVAPARPSSRLSLLMYMLIRHLLMSSCFAVFSIFFTMCPWQPSNLLWWTRCRKRKCSLVKAILRNNKWKRKEKKIKPRQNWVYDLMPMPLLGISPLKNSTTRASTRKIDVTIPHNNDMSNCTDLGPSLLKAVTYHITLLLAN